MRGYAFSLIRDHHLADDIVQTVMANLFDPQRAANRAIFNNKAMLLDHVNRAVRWAVNDEKKRKGRKAVSLNEDIPDEAVRKAMIEADSGPLPFSDQDILGWLNNSEERDVIKYRSEGLTFLDISKLMGLSI